ncbi:MAG TPA: structural protein P5 [Candidatus Alistipes merdipullorum]|nr:structural protein P5 [Candidatus Alistipes merdipullorum]
MTRGYRNNNPLNMRHDNDRWQGEVAPSQDGAFKQFETMAWGYRAAFKLLHNYQKNNGCRILSDFINRWAPPSENNTSAYISTVAKRAGLSDVSEIDTLKGDTMRAVVSAMSYVENGVEADEADVAAGWELFMQNR